MGRAGLTVYIIIGICVLLGCILAFGPRVEVTTELRPIELPDDLDAYLQRSESALPNLRPGNQKEIVWHRGRRATRTAYAIVYIHGFTSSREELAPLCQSIASQLGANVFYTRLSGHGRDADAMAEPSVNDWLNDTFAAYEIGRRIGRRVVMVGNSTGALLTLWLAAVGLQQPRDLAALVLLAPNFHPDTRAARLLLAPWSRFLVRLVAGRYKCWKEIDPRQRQYWTMCYHTDSLITMMGAVKLVEQMDLSRVVTPTLMFYSPADRVVDSNLIEERFGDIGSAHKELVAIDDCGDANNHILAGDVLSPETTDPIAQKVVEFVRQLG